ncbi:G-protein coupled receptor 4-like [Lepisosteus oculatus]|uniref:G-protein coupled receptor 4-like n=1 Tax=Lepisosteus oculatus TaxID=7918 RepID=UPI0035F523E6
MTHSSYSDSTSSFNNSKINASGNIWEPFDGCEEMPAGLLFDLGVQIFNVFLGIPANIMVMWLLLKHKNESSTSDIFIFNLAVLDGLFGCMIPLGLINIYVLQSNDAKAAQRFAYGIKDMGSPLFLSCICLDRYIAVLHPIAFTGLKDHKYRAGLSVVVLAITLAYSITKAFKGTEIENFDKIFTASILASFAFMIFCNISILWALKRSGPGKDEMHPMKKKAFKIVLSILATIVFNYLPPVALFPFQKYYDASAFTCYIVPVVFSFVNISSSTQPLLYLSRVENKLPCLLHSNSKMCCSAQSLCQQLQPSRMRKLSVSMP